MPVRDLHPKVLVDGAPHIVAVHLLAAVPRRGLGPAVGSLDAEHDRLLRALDVLLPTGL
jgi:hypothetical protein